MSEVRWRTKPQKGKKKRPQIQNAGRRLGNCSVCGKTFHRDDKLRVAKKCHECAEKLRASRYGLSDDELTDLYDRQDSRCAGCGIHEQDLAPRGGDPEHQKLAIDHDHRTGNVRGLLCAGCNYGLGCVNDDAATLRRLADYIDEASGNRR